MLAHTNKILSIVQHSSSQSVADFTRVIGRADCKILKFFSLPIAHSTWILTLDNSLAVSTFFCES